MRHVGWSLAPRRRATRGDERGAALIEFALILPVLASLLMGTVTGGAAYYEKITMTDAVREGSRFGATLTDGTGFGTSVRDRTVQLATSELGNADVCVQLVRAGSPETVVRSWSPSGGSCPASVGTAPATPSMPSGYCVVKVWSHRTATLQAFFFTRTLELTAKSVAAYERGATPGVC
jgi:Flp pilus assembly protein TadG